MQTAPHMMAATLTQPGRVEIQSVPLPVPQPGQVRVRLEGCGLCGSNLALWEGRPWFTYPLAPGQAGHEGWGSIDALGKGVSGLRRGERVAFLSRHAFAAFDLAQVDAVVPIAPALEGEPMPGEALGCAMNVFERSDIQAGQTVAVVGIGFLGALVTSLAAQAGARVLALTRREIGLQAARAMGASHTLGIQDPGQAMEQVMQITCGQGCDRVVEAAGYQATLDLAGELTREGGRLVIAGYHQDGPRQVNLQMWNWKGLDVINAHERAPSRYVRGMARAMEWMEKGKLHPQSLYTHRYPLNRLGEAFQDLQERPETFLKALITL